jgi:hypothetical protein
MIAFNIYLFFFFFIKAFNIYLSLCNVIVVIIVTFCINISKVDEYS